jgi:hypothetical protein
VLERFTNLKLIVITLPVRGESFVSCLFFAHTFVMVVGLFL